MSASYPAPALLRKICQRADLAASLAQLPRPWVFTNGVFDVLHRGHVLYLAHARALQDVVGKRQRLRRGGGRLARQEVAVAVDEQASGED